MWPADIEYLPAAGAVLAAGQHTLSVTFTPNDTTRFDSANWTVQIMVLKATPLISWAAPAAIMSGTALGATQLNAVANVAGTFVYTPASGTVLAAGAQVLSAGFTPADPANYNPATASVTISVTAGASTVVVSSSNAPSLFGVPITLTATVMPAVAGGTIAFKDGAATIVCLAGSVPTAPVATCKTSSLSIGTHLVKAVYTPGITSGQTGATSAAFAQVVSPSAKLQVKFNVYALQDSTSKPKVATFPAKNAVVKVFSTATSCVGNIFSALNPKKWGTIFDGADGVGGADGCAPVAYGTYQATGTTDVNGNVTIIVPPLALGWNNQYLVIGRSTNFDYIKTAVAGDTLYSNYPVLAAPAGTTRSVPLSFVATFNGARLRHAVDLRERDADRVEPLEQVRLDRGGAADGEVDLVEADRLAQLPETGVLQEGPRLLLLLRGVAPTPGRSRSAWPLRRPGRTARPGPGPRPWTP